VTFDSGIIVSEVLQ